MWQEMYCAKSTAMNKTKSKAPAFREFTHCF